MSNKYQLWAGEYDMCMHVFQQSLCVCVCVSNKTIKETFKTPIDL